MILYRSMARTIFCSLNKNELICNARLSFEYFSPICRFYIEIEILSVKDYEARDGAENPVDLLEKLCVRNVIVILLCCVCYINTKTTNRNGETNSIRAIRFFCSLFFVRLIFSYGHCAFNDFQ